MVGVLLPNVRKYHPVTAAGKYWEGVTYLNKATNAKVDGKAQELTHPPLAGVVHAWAE
jgi:hypothetical protein